jgi:CO/xanthine dehydrogenase Mo-binding subunit
MNVASRPFIRSDGRDKVTGSGRYTADLTLTGMLHAKFKYADVSHARIVRLDTSKAKAHPGVFAVLTQADVPDILHGPGVEDHTLFVRDVARFEGDIVAAVAAVTPEIAAQAVDLIEVEYESLPVVNEIDAALRDDAPLVHTDWASYGAMDGLVRQGNDASHSTITRGDVEAGMRAADQVIKSRYVADASHAAPIEPRAIVAQWEGDKLTVWTSTQVPFQARDGIAATLQIPQNQVRVIVPHMGGGFGGKCGVHFEPHVAALAKKVRRPVRLVFSRREEFIAPDKRREGMIVEIETGVKNDGTITARRGHLMIDNGAYTSDGAVFPQLASMHIAGPYKIPHVHIDAHLAYTNHQPSGSVRAPTAPQGCWALESHTDEVAHALGMDPVEFRRKNAVDNGEQGPTGQTYENIGLQECIEKAVEISGYGQPLPDDEAIGVAIGWWPSFFSGSGAFVKLNGDGSGTIITGAQECGTGAVMSLSILAADELGLKPEDFRIIYQDTDAGPFDLGATGSQTVFNNGRAVQQAAQEVAQQLRNLAAEKLEAAAADIELVDGQARVKGSPDSSVTIAELAGIAHGGELLLGRGSATPNAVPEAKGVSCIGDVGLTSWVAPQFSCHAVRVRLDRATGVVRVLHVTAAHDSGTIINPIGAQGQVEGGVMMGIGQALTEITRYGEDGRQLNTALLDYKLQTMADAPNVAMHFVQTAAPDCGPRGAKGLAEAPNVATAAAISNAIQKLLGRPVRHLPMTAERVWETMNP